MHAICVNNKLNEARVKIKFENKFLYGSMLFGIEKRYVMQIKYNLLSLC